MASNNKGKQSEKQGGGQGGNKVGGQSTGQGDKGSEAEQSISSPGFASMEREHQRPLASEGGRDRAAA